MEPLPLSVAHPKAYIVEERLASLAPWGDGDHGGHADDHAQHGQRRAHLVARQCLARDE